MRSTLQSSRETAALREVQLIDRVIAIIERETGEKITADTRLDTLPLDSLEFYELALAIEVELGIPTEKTVQCETVADFA